MTRAIVKDAANLPTLEENTSARLYVDTRGRLHTAGGGGGGGSGDASASNQETQIAAEQAIQIAVESIDGKTPADPATVTSVQSVATAIQDLGDGTTLDQVATAINTVNTTLGSPMQEGGTVSVSNFPAIQAISAASLPLPSGAATAANQVASSASLSSIDSKLANPMPISAASLPLPSGASTSALQTSGNASLSSIDTKFTNPLPVSVSSLPLPTGAATAAHQITANASLSSIDGKLPALSTGPTPTTQALPTREVPSYASGRQYHAQTSVGIANASSKLLFGFSNGTGANVYVMRIHCSNTQTTNITGVVGQMNVTIGSGVITGGTTITTGSSPALQASYRDVSQADPVGLTWNTGGTLGGTTKVIESCRWSTDEVIANGTGLANEIAAFGVYYDTFDFYDDPIVIPDGYSIAVLCDSALTNGTTLVDYNLHF